MRPNIKLKFKPKLKRVSKIISNFSLHIGDLKDPAFQHERNSKHLEEIDMTIFQNLED